MWRRGIFATRHVSDEIENADHRNGTKGRKSPLPCAPLPEDAHHEPGGHGWGKGHGDLIDCFEVRSELIALRGPEHWQGS